MRVSATQAHRVVQTEAALACSGLARAARTRALRLLPRLLARVAPQATCTPAKSPRRQRTRVLAVRTRRRTATLSADPLVASTAGSKSRTAVALGALCVGTGTGTTRRSRTWLAEPMASQVVAYTLSVQRRLLCTPQISLHRLAYCPSSQVTELALAQRPIFSSARSVAAALRSTVARAGLDALTARRSSLSAPTRCIAVQINRRRTH